MKLFAFERRWLLCIMCAIVPGGPEGSGFPSPRELPLERFIDDFFRHTPPSSSIGVRAGVWLVMVIALLRGLRFRPFTRMTAEEQAELLESMSGSRVYALREVPMLLKLTACLGYCGAPTVQRAFDVTAHDGRAPTWMEVAE